MDTTIHTMTQDDSEEAGPTSANCQILISIALWIQSRLCRSPFHVSPPEVSSGDQSSAPTIIAAKSETSASIGAAFCQGWR